MLKNSIFVIFVMILTAGTLIAGAYAQATLPVLPKPIQNLVDEGAQVRFLGKDYGFDAWLTIKNGQEQYFYVLPDGSAFVMGMMFNREGQMVTLDQVQKLRAQGDTLLDTLASDVDEMSQQAESAENFEFKTPGERLYHDMEISNWLPLGQTGAPIAYAFIDPQCPHCHEFINDLRKDYIEKGRMQLRIIPVGFKDETRAQAAFLLATPDPQGRWFRHMDGDKEALPARSDINDQGVQRNMAIMQSWQFSVTPMIVYRAQDNTVKIVRGRPKDTAALVADLGARG